jgi:hypothetical protein
MPDLNSNRYRVLLGIILSIILLFLSIFYSFEYENHLKTPSYGGILSNYPLNGEVQVYGDVKKLTSDGFYIEQNYKGHLVTFKIISKEQVGLDDKVNVIGVLGPENTIVSVKYILVNYLWKYDFILIRSFLALFFLIFIFTRYWSFDREMFVFRRR